MSEATTQAPPRLRAGELLLRAPTPDDVPAITAACQSPDMARWTASLPQPYRRSDAEAAIDRWTARWGEGTQATFSVEEGGGWVGQVSLRPRGWRAAEIGYLLAPAARGRGVMSASVREVLRWAFTRTSNPLDVVRWTAIAGNWTSRRVAWSAGFRVEGLRRSGIDQRGTMRDTWVASITRGDPTGPAHPWLDVPRVDLGNGTELRAARPDEDALRAAQACSDPVTQQWLPELPSPYRLTDAAVYLTSHDEQHATARGLHWVLARTQGPLVGAISLVGLSPDAPSLGGHGEIGYWMHPDARGRGLMAAAVRAVARHGLLPPDVGGLGLRRVAVRVARGNEASLGVALSAGFREVGVERDGARMRDGGLRDFVVLDHTAAEHAAGSVTGRVRGAG